MVFLGIIYQKISTWNILTDSSRNQSEVYKLIKQKSIGRIGRALGTLAPVLANFDKNNEVTSQSGMHRKASINKDMGMLLNELMKDQVFQEHDGDRAHAQFPHPKDVLHQLTKDNFKKWVYEHLRTYKL